MRINVPANTLVFEDPRGKHLKDFKGKQTILIRASQVGNGITINCGEFSAALTHQDAQVLIALLMNAVSDNVKIPHDGWGPVW